MIQKPDKSDKQPEQRTPGPLSPRRTTELAGRDQGSKGKGYSREGSDGTPSMGSSYSDLDGKLLPPLFRHVLVLTTEYQMPQLHNLRWRKLWLVI
jgi:hypothetical protein